MKQEEADRDQFLATPEGGKVAEVGMTLRVPKTLKGPKSFGPDGAVAAGFRPGFDLRIPRPVAAYPRTQEGSQAPEKRPRRKAKPPRPPPSPPRVGSSWRTSTPS